MSISNIAVTNHHTKLFEWEHDTEVSDEVNVTNGKSTHVNDEVFDLELDASLHANKRKCFDGNYYTLTFPDDFVGTVNSKTTDPFYKYRSKTAPYPIDVQMNVTLTVPYGMSIGANTHGLHAYYRDTRLAFGVFSINHMNEMNSGLSSGTWPTGISFGSLLYWNSDPAILLDLDSTKFTKGVLNKLNITIDNSGNTIGAGGIGGSGGHSQNKNHTHLPGGGGGGGQGIHQVEFSSGVSIAGGDREFVTGEIIALGVESPEGNKGKWTSADGYVGPVFAGISGVSGSYAPGMDGGPGSGPAANGVMGTLAANGVGGAVGTSAEDRDPDVFLDPTNGSFGGNVIYLRSNVAIDYTLADSVTVRRASRITGTTVNIINRSSGFMFGGGGGGAGGLTRSGIQFPGPGITTPDAGSAGGSLGENGEQTIGLNARPGAAGALLFWNTQNVFATFTTTNEGAVMKARDLVGGIKVT